MTPSQVRHQIKAHAATQERRRLNRDPFIGEICKQGKYRGAILKDLEEEAHLEWVARNGGPDSRNLGRQLASGLVSKLVIDWRYCHAL